MAIKLLFGGSPCTYWSVAQSTEKRETSAEGQGWELFKNYLIAKEKFQPDFFLYENNKSAAPEIKEQICQELGVDLMYINSALVSAQNRQRFYAFNWEVEQPEERGYVVADILDTDATENEQSYPLVAVSKEKKLPELTAQNKVGSIGGRSQSHTVHSTCGKSVTLMANGGGQGAKTGLYAVPVRIGDVGSNGQGQRIYHSFGKSVTLTANGGGRGAKTGLYAVPVRVGIFGRGGQGERLYGINGKSVTHIASGGVGVYVIPEELKSTGGKPITRVENGKVLLKAQLCDIRLPDGDYVIRKLSPLECERLQTMPDGYTEGVSNTQRYKGLGNGWTAEVIIHILQGALGELPRDTELQVLSMYDGIGTGRYCLEKMGFTNVEYHAYEIDNYAMTISKKNYPDIHYHGDAFDLRQDDWCLT